MTREEIKNTPELIDFMLDNCVLADSRAKVRKRLEEICDMAIKSLEQEPKFMIKGDGTIEQIKNCDDCLLKKEWEKIGKLLSVVLKKQTEQEPILDKIIAEIEAQINLHDTPFEIDDGIDASYCEGLNKAKEIIDKYTSESEDKE